MGIESTELRHLKRVSRIKHQILTRYLPSWAVILGSTFDLLYYVDCFAGPGRYESDGEQVDGSPIIAVKAGKEFATKNSGKKLGVVLVDDDHAQLKQLQECLGSTLPYPRISMYARGWPTRTPLFRRSSNRSEGCLNSAAAFSR